VNAAHALFEAVGVPGDVVVEHQVTELQVDALASGLRRDHHLGFAFEGLFGGDAGLQRHPAVNGDDAIAPLPQPLFEVLQRIARLGEHQYLGGIGDGFARMRRIFTDSFIFRKSMSIRCIRVHPCPIHQFIQRNTEVAQFDFVAFLDDRPRLLEQLFEGLDFRFQFGAVFSAAKRFPQRLLFPTLFFAQFLHFVQRKGLARDSDPPLSKSIGLLAQLLQPFLASFQ